MSVYEWSLSDLALTMYGIPFQGGGSDQGFLNLTMPEVASAIEGVHGDSIAANTGKSVGKGQLHLLWPSPSNQQLWDVYGEQINNNAGVGDFYVEHVVTGMQFVAKVKIRKAPDQDFKPEIGENVWELDLHDIKFKRAERAARP